jgi:hippurate hydrolase
MYRADMDCNPVKEVTGLTWASKKMVKAADGTAVPVMHACGHDAHITWLLGAAKVMADIKNQWKGTLVLVAQPAEEIGEGAKAMVKDPLFMQRVPVPDFVFGMHSWPTAVGTIVNKPGESMSGVDFLDIEFLGLGGHGALPETTKDPVVMVCTAVLQYQTIISRQVAAQDVAVLTVGSIHAGNGNNVIPAQATARLSLRWFNEKTRQTVLDGIIRINEGLAVAYGLPVEKKPLITMKAHIAPVINEPRLATSMNEWLSGKMPAEKIIADGAPIMMAEDFTYLVRDTTKSVYDFMLIGIASPVEVEAALNEGKVSPFSNHSGNFKVDLAAIPHGVEVASNALLGFFNGKFTGGK